jgi:hypothetical protein
MSTRTATRRDRRQRRAGPIVLSTSTAGSSTRRPAACPSADDETRKIKAVDVDGDRDLDLVVANVRFVRTSPRRTYLLLNDGSGVFTTADTARLPGAGRSQLHPFKPSTSTTTRRLGRARAPHGVRPAASPRWNAFGDYLVLLNDGSGRFSEPTAGTILPTTAVGNGFDVEVADFDGDGIADLFLCNRASSRRGARGIRRAGRAPCCSARGPLCDLPRASVPSIQLECARFGGNRETSRFRVARRRRRRPHRP